MTDPTEPLTPVAPEVQHAAQEDAIHHAVEQMPTRTRREARQVWGLYAAFVGLACAITVIGLVLWHTTDDQAKTKHLLSVANARIVALGGTPVAGPAGAAGPAGPPPTLTEVEDAVTRYCTQVSCGIPPSAGQVAQAVSTFCNAHAQCSGPGGKTGRNGNNGLNGHNGSPGATGAEGPGPTSDQVAAAVSSFCAAHNQCQGPAGASGSRGASGATVTGPPGENGSNGADGQPPLSWTYVDHIGMTHTCTRDDPFNPAAPTYHCD